MLESDAMEDGAAVKVDEEATVVFVDCKEEYAVRRGGDTTEIGGGLRRQCNSFGFDEVSDGNTVTNRGDKKTVVHY